MCTAGGSSVLLYQRMFCYAASASAFSGVTIMKCLLLYTSIWIINSGIVVSGSVLDKINNVGCYDLGYSLRKNFHHHMAGVTIETCVNFCCKKNTKYAGVEQSDNFCYCGGDIAEESIKRLDTLCNVRCRGQENLLCGGDWLMSLYDISGSCGDGCTASSDGQVRFLVAMSIGVRLYKKECSKEFDTIIGGNDWVNTVDYHYSKNLMFYLMNKRLYKTTLQPASSTPAAGGPTLIRNLTGCEGFTVDWVSDRIYWADCNSNTIMSMNLDGSDNNAIVNRPEELGTIKRMEVDPYKGMLFWTTDGVIESCQLGDVTNFRTNVSRPGVTVRALSIDMAARRVYYVGSINGTASLFSMNYNGGDQREVFTMSEVMSVYGLGLLSGSAYWVNYASSRDVLYKSSLTNPNSLQISAPIERAVWHMKVVHPSIQRRPNTTFDPCEDKLCAHACEVESPTTATCTCPDDQQLDSDGISCISSLPQPTDSAESDPCLIKGCSYYCSLGPESPPTATCHCPEHQELDADGITCITIAIETKTSLIAESVSIRALLVGILLVMAIVIISGLLVYLGDKYWSHLHMKFTGTPYTRKRDCVTEDESNYHASTTFNTSEDNVILVN